MNTYLQKILDRQLAGNQEKPVGPATFKTVAPLDVALIFDTTGSMYQYLEEVRQKLGRLAAEIPAALPNARIGVVAFGDYDDPYVTKVLPLTGDFQQVRAFIGAVEKTDGGDAPEAVEAALREANQLDWRLGSTRVIVLVGDAPPHGVDDPMLQFDYQEETHALAQQGIRIYATQCGADPSTEATFRWMASQTKGMYLPLANIADIVDLLIGICMKAVGSLGDYQQKLSSQKPLTDSQKRVFKLLTSGHNE